MHVIDSGVITVGIDQTDTTFNGFEIDKTIGFIVVITYKAIY